MRYRLLCLDAGFTILTPRDTLADALEAALTDHGHHATQEEMRAAWEATDRWFWDEYHRPDNDTWTDDQRITSTWRRFHARFLDELGLREGADEVVEILLAGQFSPDAWEAYPDVEPLLQAMEPARRDGLQIGIVSDWGSELRGIFAALEIDRYCDFILASAQVGLAKPDPAFFRVALDRAGVAAVEAVMVGDSYRADVQGARAAGMAAILLDRSGEATQDDVPVIRSLLELPRLLEGDVADLRSPVEADA